MYSSFKFCITSQSWFLILTRNENSQVYWATPLKANLKDQYKAMPHRATPPMQGLTSAACVCGCGREKEFDGKPCIGLKQKLNQDASKVAEASPSPSCARYDLKDTRWRTGISMDLATSLFSIWGNSSLARNYTEEKE